MFGDKSRKSSRRQSRRSAALGIVIFIFGIGAGCNRSPQEQEAKFLKRGHDYFKNKDYSRALLDFRNASKAMPKDAEPVYQMGLAYLASGSLTSAIGSFRKALELNPKHAEAQLKLAQLMASTSDRVLLAKAVGSLQDLLAASPANPDADDTLALAESKLGNTADAVQRLENTLKKFPARLQTSEELAQVKLKNRDLDGAEAVLRQAVVSAPQSAPAELALGQFFMLSKQPALAEKELRKATQLDAKNGEALAALAAVEAALNRTSEADETYRRASESGDPQFRPAHAMFLFRQGKRDAAIAELEKLAKEAPDDRAARNRLFTAYMAAGQTEPARNLVASALKKNPKDIDALYQRARMSQMAGKTSDAEQDLQQVLHFRPDYAEGHVMMADLERDRGLSMNERKELTEALKINPGLLDARLRLARNYTKSGDPKAAIELLDAAPAAQKTLPPLVVERNWALIGAGDFQELRATLNQTSEAKRPLDLVLQDGLARLQKADYSGAAAAAEEAIRDNPQDVRGPRLLADVYLAQKQPAKAEARLKELTVAHPKSAPLANLLGMWYLNARNFPAATKSFEAALAADPKFTPAVLAIAGIELQERKYDSARSRLEGLLATDHKNLPALIMLGDVADGAGDSEQAVRQYRAALAVDDSNALACNKLANALVVKDPDEALTYAEKAAQLAPENATVEDTLGRIYFRKAIYSTAETYLENAVKTSPTPRRQYHLAMCYMKLGKRDLGAKALEIALQKDPALVNSEKVW